MIEVVVLKIYRDPTDEAYNKLCRKEISEQEYLQEVEKSRERMRRTGSSYIEERIEINIETDEEPEKIDYDSGHPYR